jgi:hypothetical protein
MPLVTGRGIFSSDSNGRTVQKTAGFARSRSSVTGHSLLFPEHQHPRKRPNGVFCLAVFVWACRVPFSQNWLCDAMRCNKSERTTRHPAVLARACCPAAGGSVVSSRTASCKGERKQTPPAGRPASGPPSLCPVPNKSLSG